MSKPKAPTEVIDPDEFWVCPGPTDEERMNRWIREVDPLGTVQELLRRLFGAKNANLNMTWYKGGAVLFRTNPPRHQVYVCPSGDSRPPTVTMRLTGLPGFSAQVVAAIAGGGYLSEIEAEAIHMVVRNGLDDKPLNAIKEIASGSMSPAALPAMADLFSFLQRVDVRGGLEKHDVWKFNDLMDAVKGAIE